ncbi:MAG: hypothetical protein QME96_04020 [Myxococcota bacterium]|nr:hypothetical protein [Myxococcota bacterium]
MAGDVQGRASGVDPADVREPLPAERVRALPMVSVALGSLALGFCLVYFVCRPEGPDRSGEGRSLPAGDAVMDRGTAAPAPAVDPGVGAGGSPEVSEPGVPAPERPVLDPPAPPPSAPAPVPESPVAPSAAAGSVFGSRLTLVKTEIRKCAGADGVELPKERCGRVRGMDLFMARNEGVVKDCIERSFPVAPERPSLVAVTMAVNFEAKTMQVSIPGSDEARAAQYRALRDCLVRGLGAPEYARIDRPHAAYRFVFTYSYAR